MTDAQKLIAEVLRRILPPFDGFEYHVGLASAEIDKAFGGLARQEQWVPVEESGHRWSPRSEHGACYAMEHFSATGDNHDPELDSPVDHIEHETRWVSGWSEA